MRRSARCGPTRCSQWRRAFKGSAPSSIAFPKALRAACRSTLLGVRLTSASREVWSVCHGCAVRRPGLIQSSTYPSDRRGLRCASLSGSRDLCAAAAAAWGCPRPDRALRGAVGVLGLAGREWCDVAAVLGGGVVRSIDAGYWPAPLASRTRHGQGIVAASRAEVDARLSELRCLPDLPKEREIP